MVASIGTSLSVLASLRFVLTSTQCMLLSMTRQRSVGMTQLSWYIMNLAHFADTISHVQHGHLCASPSIA